MQPLRHGDAMPNAWVYIRSGAESPYRDTPEAAAGHRKLLKDRRPERALNSPSDGAKGGTARKMYSGWSSSGAAGRAW